MAGLVELADSDRQTLTGEAERLQHLADVVTVSRSPYRAYLDRVRRNGQRDCYGIRGAVCGRVAGDGTAHFISGRVRCN